VSQNSISNAAKKLSPADGTLKHGMGLTTWMPNNTSKHLYSILIPRQNISLKIII